MTTTLTPSPVIDLEAPTVHARAQLDRPLPILSAESGGARWRGAGVIAIVVGLYAFMTLTYWAPADGGVDQNAYLLGGRMIAEHFSPRYTLPNPFAYSGNMMVRITKANVPGGDYFPKYPFGLPLLYAVFFWTAGATHATKLAFLVSPVSAILAVAGMFFLARLVAGSFAAVMASILLATSQLMIELSNNPNSHASCTAFIVWGMYLLLKWWQTGRIWQGLFAGFLLGYAGLIRYSEGLLVLPIAVACASRLRWTDWKSYLRCAVPGLMWAVPVGTMLIYNKHSMGNWTGYDSTNESEGFTWIKFKETWEQMIRTYYDMGAFFVLPLGLAGIAMIFRRSWQMGILMLAWLIPGTALYTAYYWSPDRGISYARFILTLVPAVMLGVAICFKDGILVNTETDRWYHNAPRAFAVGTVVAIAAALGVYRSVHGLQQGISGGPGLIPLAEEYRSRQSLADTGQNMLDHIPVNAVVFVDNVTGGGGGGGNEKPLNYIQFLRHWDVYTSDAFDLGGPRRAMGGAPGGPGAGGGRRNNNFGGGNFGGGNFGGGNFGGQANPDPNADPNALVPTARQQLQVDYEQALYNRKTGSDLRVQLGSVINLALKAGHGVYALVSVANDRDVRRTIGLAGKYKIKAVDTWSDLPPESTDLITETGNTNGRRRPGGGGGPNGGGGGRRGPGNGGGLTAMEPTVTTWEILEIKPAV